MWGAGVSILGLGALCGLWVVFQRWIGRVDPEQRGVEGGCGSCHEPVCDRRDAPVGKGAR